jgi:hypothetical protein
VARARQARQDVFVAAQGHLLQDIRGRGEWAPVPGGMSVPAPSMALMPPAITSSQATAAVTGWDALRARAQAATAGLATPPEPGPGVCASCRAPLRRGYARCFQCDRHAESAPGMLADVVAPVAYAPKGSRLARDLWLYKSAEPGSAEAAAELRALLLVFLRDHGRRVWQQARMTVPTHACVVPSCRGRPGPHPLRALLRGFLALPWTELLPQAGADRWGRDLDPDRFRAPGQLTGAAVLLLDDTWTSGASVQSAAVALKQAGARSVAAVVLGRHGPPATGLPPGSRSIG